MVQKVILPGQGLFFIERTYFFRQSCLYLCLVLGLGGHVFNRSLLKFITPLYYVQDVQTRMHSVHTVRSIYKHIYVTQWSQICIFICRVGMIFNKMPFWPFFYYFPGNFNYKIWIFTKNTTTGFFLIVDP